MKKSNTLVYSYLFYTLAAFSISVSFKANIGISSLNAMNMALSEMTYVKIGTIATIINLMFLLSYMIITRFKEHKTYIIQLISLLMFGYLINLFTYQLLGNLDIQNYQLRLLLISISTLMSGLSIGMIINYGKITFPIESFCVVLSKKTKLSFSKARYGVDLIALLISLSVSLTQHLPFFVREGTIISLLLFTGAINYTRVIYHKKETLKTQQV